MARDLESPAPCTLYDSLPAITDAPHSDHPPLPASKRAIGREAVVAESPKAWKAFVVGVVAHAACAAAGTTKTPRR